MLLNKTRSQNNNILFFFVLGFLHGVQREFADDVSETAVGLVFTGHK